MTIAEIRGKISASGANLSERMEDLLTSDVFGAFRYLPLHLGLLNFLGTCRSNDGSAFATVVQPVRANWSFWPYLEHARARPCEPDVVIGLEDKDENVHLVMVEAKYESGKSSLEDEGERPNDQLARELHNLELLTARDLGWAETKRIVARTMVYITQDAGIPLPDISQSLMEYQRKRKREGEIFWTSWRYLPRTLEILIGRTDDENHQAILTDLFELLLKKHLTMFHGMELLEFAAVLDDFAFYQIAPSRYSWPNKRFISANFGFYEGAVDRYHWPSIPS